MYLAHEYVYESNVWSDMYLWERGCVCLCGSGGGGDFTSTFLTRLWKVTQHLITSPLCSTPIESLLTELFSAHILPLLSQQIATYLINSVTPSLFLFLLLSYTISDDLYILVLQCFLKFFFKQGWVLCLCLFLCCVCVSVTVKVITLILSLTLWPTSGHGKER